MNKYGIWMLLGCGGAFLLLQVLPALGVGNNVTFIIFFIVMLACHLMMGGHHAHSHERKKSSEDGRDYASRVKLNTIHHHTYSKSRENRNHGCH